MFTAYLVITIVTAVANAGSAAADFARYQQIAVGMAKVGVPVSWMTMLGAFKAAGALGLLVGIAVRPIGSAAAIGLILFFIAAMITHLRVRDYSSSLALAFGFLLLAVAGLATGYAV